MTKLDDSAAVALALFKGTENTVQSFRALTPAHRTQLARDFPTLTTALSLLSAQWAHAGLDNGT